MATKNSKALAVPTSDRDWRAEDDMRVLIQASAIRKDPKRLAAARAAAKRRLVEEKDRLDGMKALANG